MNTGGRYNGNITLPPQIPVNPDTGRFREHIHRKFNNSGILNILIFTGRYRSDI